MNRPNETAEFLAIATVALLSFALLFGLATSGRAADKGWDEGRKAAIAIRFNR